jgi:proton-dependent oligopeptide transporter, POT family
MVFREPRLCLGVSTDTCSSGWIADSKLGRFKTIHIAIAISTIAHVILVVASVPSVIKKTDTSFGVFILGLLSLCVGTGFFKANIGPLLAEQNRDRIRVVAQKNGERVILDPALTNARLFLYFYFAINIGALVGQISMVYTEKYVGFWLAFLLPTVLFLISPFVLWSNKKKYHLTPPTGSVLGKFVKMFLHTTKKSGWFKKMNWDHARPSLLSAAERPSWMTYDDEWVDQVRRGLEACKVFLFLPIFHLAYNQMTGNLTSQAGSMELHGVPNDIIQNLNPISIVLMIPIFDKLLYPGLEKIGFHFTPIKRMTAGFFFSAASMVAACVMQYYIYKLSPCGDLATECEEGKAPINVWAQCLPYILIGISEIFTNVTSYEYAFSKAPENMKSLVMAVNLFMSAFASAVGQAFTPLSEDPKLVWNYGIISIIAFVGGAAFWLCFRHLDHDEDKWNMIRKTKFLGKSQPIVDAHNTEDLAHVEKI